MDLASRIEKKTRPFDSFYLYLKNIFFLLRTNCSTNPYCLNGLGEKKLINQMKESNLQMERSNYFRNLDEHVGLVNLGATCYINAYLQVK
jgi:hypothetical protein